MSNGAMNKMKFWWKNDGFRRVSNQWVVQQTILKNLDEASFRRVSNQWVVQHYESLN